MKNTIFGLIAVFFILTAGIAAQSRYTPRERLKNLKEKLNLTDEQSVKIENILTASDSEIQNLRSGKNPDRQAFREIMNNSNEEISKILDDKQKAEFNKMLEERRNQHRNNSYKNK